MKTPTTPPAPGVSPPRNDFGPRQFLAALDVLSRRQAARAARFSPTTRLRDTEGLGR